MSRSSRRAPAQSEEEQNGQENDAIEVAHILQNCDYTRLHPVCNTLMNDLSQRINRMDEIIKPSIQAAISWTRRHQQGVGVSQQTVMNDPTIVDKLTSCRDSIRVSCIKQCELSILRDLLQTVSSECIQGRLPPNRNWIEWFQQQGQTIEADPETMRKKQEKVEKVLHLFDRQTKYSPPSDAPHDPAHAVDAGSDDSNAHDPGVDGDIDVIDQTDSSQLSIHDVTCKLSLGLYHEPMRNEACPHTYSKREILNHLTHKYHQQSGSPLSRRDASPSSSSNLPNEFECLCPIAGCKKMVALATLTPDETMARKVKQFHQQKSQQSATHATVATAASSSSSSASSTGRPSRKRGRVKEEDLTQSEE